MGDGGGGAVLLERCTPPNKSDDELVRGCKVYACTPTLRQKPTLPASRWLLLLLERNCGPDFVVFKLSVIASNRSTEAIKKLCELLFEM